MPGTHPTPTPRPCATRVCGRSRWASLRHLLSSKANAALHRRSRSRTLCLVQPGPACRCRVTGALRLMGRRCIPLLVGLLALLLLAEGSREVPQSGWGCWHPVTAAGSRAQLALQERAACGVGCFAWHGLHQRSSVAWACMACPLRPLPPPSGPHPLCMLPPPRCAVSRAAGRQLLQGSSSQVIATANSQGASEAASATSSAVAQVGAASPASPAVPSELTSGPECRWI